MLRTGTRARDRSADPLRVAVLCSRRAPGLTTLLQPGADAPYRVVAVVASDPASTALPDTAGAAVPCMVHDIRAFYREREARLTDLSVRPLYDAATTRLLTPARPELLVLCGYLHIVTDPLLDVFPHRVINIHDSDLVLVDDGGRPRYRGLRSTRDAIAAGEPETRSTVHIVTGEVDTGPPLVRSWGFAVHPMVAEAREWNATDLLKAYAYAQREWMMRAAWGRMLATAIAMFAHDEVRVLGKRAHLSGIPGPVTLEREARPARRPPWRAATGSRP